VDKALSNIKDPSFLGVGWSFPVTFSAGNYQLITTSAEENIKRSIDIILRTKQGERSMEAQFGSGLQQFFFRKMDEALRGEIADAIKMSLLNNEPRISVLEVIVDFPDMLNGRVEVTITFVHNVTNKRHNYVFTFYLK